MPRSLLQVDTFSVQEVARRQPSQGARITAGLGIHPPPHVRQSHHLSFRMHQAEPFPSQSCLSLHEQQRRVP
jgi:hypothetical protein